MNTINDKEFDYYAYMKEHDPDVTRIRRGTEARQQRFEEAVLKYRVRLDEDIIEQFQQLVPHESCEHLINQALREWVAARDVKGLLRDELHHLIQEAFASAHMPQRTAQ